MLVQEFRGALGEELVAGGISVTVDGEDISDDHSVIHLLFDVSWPTKIISITIMMRESYRCIMTTIGLPRSKVFCNFPVVFKNPWLSRRLHPGLNKYPGQIFMLLSCFLLANNLNFWE